MTVDGDVRIVEVGPRDGLQNEAVTLPPATRIAFIEKLLAAGLRDIEAGSFVSPRAVPQMAGTGDVLAAFRGRQDVRLSVLVPNERGLDAALAAGAREIAIFAAASESFSRKNINCSIAESLTRYGAVCERARGAGVAVRGYLSCVLGCPYEGDVPVARVRDLAHALLAMGCSEVSLGDTIGVGTPNRAREVVLAVAEVVPIANIAVHFHDTYGQALANIHACLDEGVRVIDAAAGGLGGCPFAPGAAGNVATEDVVYMLNGMGLETGIDLDRLVAASRIVLEALGRRTGSKAGLALGSGRV